MTTRAAALPAGLRARPPQPADAEAVLALVVACDVQGVGSSDATLAQVAADLAAPRYDRDRGGRLVLDDAGRTVGWMWTDDDEANERVFVDPYSLDPAVLAWLLGEALAYARAVSRERGRPVEVAGGAYESDSLMTTALSDAGLSPVRRFWRMELVVDPSAAVVPPPPRGVHVARAGESEADQRLLHRLVNESFRDHWGASERTYDDWREQLDAQAGRDPEQWWVGYVDGEPAGVLIGNESEADHGIATVATLGVLRPYRGRGVAKALLRTAFAHAEGRGRTAVALFVDSESPTGATRLYESVGMSVDKVLTSWKLEVGPE